MKQEIEPRCRLIRQKTELRCIVLNNGISIVFKQSITATSINAPSNVSRSEQIGI